jgi:hypothetical protein
MIETWSLTRKESVVVRTEWRKKIRDESRTCGGSAPETFDLTLRKITNKTGSTHCQ